MFTTDYISRNPVDGPIVSDNGTERYINLVASCAIPSAISRAEFVEKSSKDERLIEVKKAIVGKPHKDIGIYARMLDTLSVTNDGLVLNNHKLCVPDALQQSLM